MSIKLGRSWKVMLLRLPRASGVYWDIIQINEKSTFPEFIINIVPNISSLYKTPFQGITEYHTKNIENLKIDLILNNYLIEFINRHVHKHYPKLNSTTRDSSSNDSTIQNDYRNTIVLSLLPRISEKIKNVLKRKCNLNTVFKCPFKMNKMLKSGKNKLKRDNNKDLIYRINCNNCPKNYVGQTKRLLKTRTGEHRDNIKLKPVRHEVVITKHILENNRTHDFDWDNVEILHLESNFYKRAFAERVYIRKQGPN